MALLAGGGGVGAGMANLIVQLAAIALLAFNGPAILNVLRGTGPGLVLLVGLTMAVPVLQLVPLPPLLWQGLPGRALEVEALTLIGEAQTWRPLSVAPARTFVGLAGLIAPFTVLLLALRLPERRGAILDVVIAGGVAVILLGGVQMASGGTTGMIYAETHGSSELFGTFANRNSSGLFLVLALAAVVSRMQVGRGALRDPTSVIRYALVFVFCVAVVLTRSRSAMALALLPMLHLAWRLLPLVRQRGRGVALGIAVLAVVAAIGAGLVAQNNDRARQALARFDDIQAVRLWIWDDALVATKRYWPVGAGVGAFDEVFQIDESIEYLEPTRAGRAHNELLEQALESGLAGVLLAAAWTGWVAVAAWRSMTRRAEPATTGAVVMICCIAFQSVLDYPLRNQALMCAAALLVAMLAAQGRDGRAKATGKGSVEAE
ncbi:O-antigen ligase family protein [Novosphingobium kaempferiae]|uniref:O-antigen ligase family protein n=1 Tax=Novosphingobium kaempferiae TaxID=2896849 RepID=UPI001E38DA93|nr:O-antigen ligase family protein [Novosphingobium kaempferiae]